MECNCGLLYSLKPIKTLKRGSRDGFEQCNLNKKFLIRDVSLSLVIIPNTLRWVKDRICPILLPFLLFLFFTIPILCHYAYIIILQF